MKDDNWVALANQSAARSRWALVGKWSGPIGGLAVGGSAGLEQYNEDSNRTDLNNGQKVARTTSNALASGGEAVAGAWAGAEAGAGAGTAVGAGIGAFFFVAGAVPSAAFGGAVGGIGGGIGGSAIGGKIGDGIAGLFD